MPLSGDPDARARQLANLRVAPAAPVGNARRFVHGGRSELLLRDVEDEVAELCDALGDALPVRDPAGGVPAADLIAVEAAARSLKRWRSLAAWCDAHGRLTRVGKVKPAAELELKAERQLQEALAALGMTPASRAKLGVHLAQAHRTLEDEAAAGRRAWHRFEAIDGDVVEVTGEGAA